MPRKIVINDCYGGFGLSKEAYEYMGLKWDNCGSLYGENISRDNPKLVECIEKLGEKANGSGARLRVIEIPEDVNWEIEEYDGIEWVSEKHRTWE